MKIFESFFGEKRKENSPEPIREERNESPETEKLKKAAEVLYLLIDAINEFLPEDQNAIMNAEKHHSNGVWDEYIKELVKGNLPVFYIDNGGITRMQIYNNELIVVHSGDMPSKIEGKTIQTVWNEVKDRYNSRISELVDELKI